MTHTGTCRHPGCYRRDIKGRGMCACHYAGYKRTIVLDWHAAGVPEPVLEAVRAGVNTACVDCGCLPLDGGLRCVACFGRCVDARREHVESGRARLRLVVSA